MQIDAVYEGSAPIQPHDVAAMFFTSGTTGNPKGVVHSHFTLIDRARAGANFDKLTGDEEVLAYLPPAEATIGNELAVSYMEELYPVTVVSVDATPAFDPANERMR